MKRTDIDWHKPHHVLVLGNSITWHPYKAEIGWRSEHGMAASRPEKDFCHVLERLLQTHETETTVTGINMAEWETTYSHEYARMIGKAVEGKDVIIIRMSENVHHQWRFGWELRKLVKHCQRTVPHVILCGCVWRNTRLEKAIAHVAQSRGLLYIPLDNIMAEHPETYPQVGDQLYDREGNAYKIETPFICTHPNDKGMEMIAETIFNALTR